MLNTIAIGFIGGGKTSAFRKIYAYHVLNKEHLPTNLKEAKIKMPEVEIAFLEKDAACVHPHNDDPMVITMR